MSLAYGTPPHIQDAQYDVPPPNIENFRHTCQTQVELDAASVFIALSGLTDVLSHFLTHLYHLKRDPNTRISSLELKLNQWVESLPATLRRIITRGTHLHLPGAANLRLVYLWTQLLQRRLELDEDREKAAVNGSSDMLANRYMQVRRTAEDIILLVQELQPNSLADFWLPVCAFVFPSTTTFLLRCALEPPPGNSSQTSQGSRQAEMENNNKDAQHTSLSLAWDLILALRSHKEKTGWDLGDICLSQHAEVVERLMFPSSTGTATQDGEASRHDMPLFDLQGVEMGDAAFIEELFPNLWNGVRY